jgi:magnesium transporter
MKRLTAFTVVLMIPTLIAGIYGMNFKLMPELDWAAGYPFALGLMALTAGAAVMFFWRHDWF